MASLTYSIHSQRYKELRTQLRTIRKAAGLTQIELALKLGIDQSYISKIELGHRFVDVLLFIDICIACGRTPDDVFSSLLLSSTSTRYFKI
jgi:transcriptional regulator with XRE-family HTH domain